MQLSVEPTRSIDHNTSNWMLVLVHGPRNKGALPLCHTEGGLAAMIGSNPWALRRLVPVMGMLLSILALASARQTPVALQPIPGSVLPELSSSTQIGPM